MQFERRLPLYRAAPRTPGAKTVERPGIHLGVWRLREGEFFVWGATRHLPEILLSFWK